MCEMVQRTNKAGRYNFAEEQMAFHKAKVIVRCFLRSEMFSPVIVSAHC